MRRITGILVAACVPLAGIEAQERWRWELGAGPLASMGSRPILLRDGYNATPADTIVWNACQGRFHLMGGASRRIASSALVARVNVSYNRCTGSARQYAPAYGTTVRNALSDELYLAEAGLQWEALPTRAFSPYLLTLVGAGHSRIGWNGDSTANRATSTITAWAPTFAAGVGARLRLGPNRALFVEWRRRYQPESLNSGKSLPITIGFRF